MHMCLKNNVDLVQKVVDTKIISKFICTPENLVANEFQFQKILLLHQVDEKHSHAHKTHLHGIVTNSSCSQTILHQFQSSAQINH